MAAFVLLLLALSSLTIQTNAQSIGVCYGLRANNLPPSSEVVSLYQSNNINLLRLYAPDDTVLNALRGSGIQVLLGTKNDELHNLSTFPSKAADWVQTNVRAYWPDVKFRYIAVGNEVIPRDPAAQYVLNAMQNIYDALGDDLQEQIKVSTAIHMVTIESSYPPSNATFTKESIAYMRPIARFLADKGAPLLLNVYPYFSYTGNPKEVSLEYATFTSPDVVVDDKNVSLEYQNLFDAMVDSVYWALEDVGADTVSIVVSESGWPSDGDPAATVTNAQTYNSNLIRHVEKGTPKKPGPIETYVFAMFNENGKDGLPTEQHFGLFYPNKQIVYDVGFH